MRDERRLSAHHTAGVVAFSALVFLWAHAPAFRHRLIVNDDVRQQVFWMARWADGRLFAGDLLADYAQHYVPWGVQALYRAASLVVDPVLFSKILTGLLFVVLAGLLFRIGLALGNRALGWTTVALYWLTPLFLDNLSGGLSRAFVAPVLALFVLGALRGQARLVMAASLLASLVAPYAFLLCATAWLIGCVLRRGEWEPLRRRGVLLAVVTGGALVLGFSVRFAWAGYGPLAGPAQLSAPEFGPEGRYPFLPPLSPLPELLDPWLSLAPFQEAGFVAGALSLLGLGLLLHRGYRGCLARGRRSLSVPGPLRILAPLVAASLLLYLLARLLALRLFFPSRYLEHTAALLTCLAIAAGVERALRFSSSRGRTGRMSLLVPVLVVGLLAAVRLRGVGLFDYGADAPLVARLQQTDRKALVAGHPYHLDNVLAFGQRRVVAAYELAHPWAHGFWARLEPRLDELFGAYYADDPALVDEFSARYGVDYWLVDERDFEPGFLDEPSVSVPLCEALHLPPALERACARTGLRLRAMDPSRRRSGCPGRAPFFTPFDQRIRRLVTDRSGVGLRRFALLDERAFPGERIGPRRRLVDVRKRRAAIMRASWNTPGSP